MRGRKPKPIATQISEGDPRKKGVRKLQARLAAEPKASKGLPACPRHLKGRARYAWKFWTEELCAMSLDRRPDAMALEGACVLYARAVQADLMIESEGLMLEIWDMGEPTLDEDGHAVIPAQKSLLSIKTNPAVAISNGAWRQLRGFCAEFGFSPVSRTRLAIEKKDDGEADLAKLLSAPRQPKPSPAVN
jgi:P27 family predicted phage terminase small subunit